MSMNDVLKNYESLEPSGYSPTVRLNMAIWGTKLTMTEVRTLMKRLLTSEDLDNNQETMEDDLFRRSWEK